MERIANMRKPEISISVVSHQQINLIQKLLRDIDEHCHEFLLEVLLTLNKEESLPFKLEDFPFPIVVIRNATPLGFAANHDQAFTHAKGRYFCVINPDIRLDDDPFQTLIACLQDTSVAVVGPIVLSAAGAVEDSARRFPSPFKIICKALGKCKGSDYVITDATIFPDWVGGMFMLFRYETFELLGGFSQKYFLYYEDVDLCARIKLHGYKVALCPGAKVVHEARRDSHREMKFFKWHLASMLRFFFSPEYWRLQFRK
jgi:N-acetylglucosaminyl-diphospho-decaprenol L-rhamnosyltransferase